MSRDLTSRHLPLEAELRNARRLLTTVPPVAMLVAIVIAASVSGAPAPAAVVANAPVGTATEAGLSSTTGVERPGDTSR